MNSKIKMVAALLGAVVLSGACAGGAVWYFMPKPAGAGADKKAEADKPKDAKPAKYVTLDKVIVMLRRGPGEDGTHYLSADLVLATTAAKEKETKENLPLLRSLAVKTLSAYTMAEASSMTVEKYADALNTAYNASYDRDHGDKPFSEVMIGKLIIE